MTDQKTRLEIFQVCALLWLSFYPCVPVQARDLVFQETRLIETILNLQEHNPRFAAEFRRTFRSLSQPKNTFNCPALQPSPTKPTSVHKLRPGDVAVVAAIGDSLTAGRGIVAGILGLAIDSRGLAWSIGGDGSYSEASTLPNIFRQYNSKLYGFSQGVGSLKARFNVAKSGAKSGDALAQAQKLVERMTSDNNVDINNDWKVITLFIGANDLCDWCEDEPKYSVDSYRNNLEATLDYLYQNVPRTFVNLVAVLNLEFVQDLKENFLCETVQTYICDCAANPANAAAEAHLIKLVGEYQEVARVLTTSGRYDAREDFTVVFQPFFLNTSYPTTADGKPDFSYFAADCFHLSRKGQAAAAEALWNNMIEPVGSKSTSWRPEEQLECPTEKSPYLYTARNSKRTQRV